MTPRPAAALFLLLALLLPALPAAAQQAPSLVPLSDEGLRDTYQTGRQYTLRMRFTDPDGNRILRAEFVDESQSAGKVAKAPTRAVGTDTREGVTLEWTVNQFAAGPHTAYFVVRTKVEETRYPPVDAQFYTFVVEDLLAKWGIMGVGLLVGLLFVPFLVYVLARTINRRGDPSRAARVGLLLGILACAALFIYLFASFYGALAYAIGIVAGLALLVLVLTRR